MMFVVSVIFFLGSALSSSFGISLMPGAFIVLEFLMLSLISRGVADVRYLYGCQLKIRLDLLSTVNSHAMSSVGVLLRVNGCSSVSGNPFALASPL